jgi:hypothetical protein
VETILHFPHPALGLPGEDDIEAARRAARDRQRLNAARLAALQGVADAVTRLAREAEASLDGLSLVTAFLDFLSEGMLGSDGVPDEDCMGFVADLAQRQSQDASNPDFLAEIGRTVVRGLANEPGKWRPFRIDYWSEERRAFAANEFRFLHFRNDGNKERWALTDEGARLTLFNLDATSGDAELQDILMRRAIDRGRVDEIGRQAEQYARAARATYIAIADGLARTRRGKGLGWEGGIGTAIDEGRTLIGQRGDAIRDTRRLITEQMSVEGLSQSRREALARIVDDLQAVLDGFSALSARIMGTYDEFGSILVSTPAGLPDNLPDYGDEILSGFLRMPAQAGLAALDELTVLLLPPSVPAVADIGMLLDATLDATWHIVEAPEEPDEADPEPPEPIREQVVLDAAVMRQASRDFLEAVQASGPEGVLLSEIARRAAASSVDDGAAACLIISAFTCARPEVEVSPYPGTFRLPGLVAGEDLLFKRRAP